MPDETSTSPVNTPVVAQPEPQISEELKAKLAKAKGPLWKKVLWWCVGILAIIVAVVLLFWLFTKQTPKQVAKEITDFVKNETFRNDMEAKIRLAQAQGAEEAALKKLEEIKNEKNEDRAFEELAKLLKAREN